MGLRMRVETMPMKKYSDEFKADAVALYETHPDMSYSQVAADLGISRGAIKSWVFQARKEAGKVSTSSRSEEHTSELQSRFDLVCRLLLEKKNIIPITLS